jgi:uncharacterized protein YjbJ (UPF0337 family)
MDSLYLKGNWNLIKGNLKQRYGDLTDKDLIYMEGKEDEMLGHLQRKLGKTKAEFITEIESLIDEVNKQKKEKEKEKEKREEENKNG